MELNAALWNGLPFNLVKRVLSFLSVPEMCRHSVVCKRWKELIRTREFGVQCAQNAAKRDASIIVLRFYHIIPIDDPEPRPHGGWALLDFSTQRWYRVEDHASLEHHRLFPGGLSMDGGLVCQNRATNREELSNTQGNSEGNQVVVYNPIAKTQKRLPIAPTHGASTHFPHLHLIVDNSHESQSFKVFLINHSFDGSDILEDPGSSEEDRLIVLNDPLVRLYDSTTNEWKSLTNPSCIQRGISDELSTVVFQGFLYLFVGSINDNESRPLWRFNLATATWENVAVEISGRIDCAELIVSANRLFLTFWKMEQIVFDRSGGSRCKIQRLCSFQVSEIRITDKAPVMTSLFRMANRDVKDFFDITTEADETYGMVAFGLGNSLLFISTDSRKSMAFNLRNKKWVPGPKVSSDHVSETEIIWDEKPRACESLWRGQSMNLILPNTTPW